MNNFDDYLKLNVNSENTKKIYSFNLKTFFKNQKEFNQETVDNYLLFLINTNKSASTFNQYLASLKMYSKFKKININFPKQKSGNKKIPSYITLDELEKEILPYFDFMFRDADRNKFLLRFMFLTGMRKSEIINLKKDDIDFDKKIIKIKNTKGKVDREIWITNEIADDIKKYISNSNTELAFNITQNIIKHIFNTLNQQLNYKKKVTPHSLRHSCAVYLVKLGYPIKQLAKYLGHKNLNTTGIYTELDNIDDKDMFYKLMKFKKGGF